MIFSFKNKETEEYFDLEFRGNAEKEEYLENNKNVIQTLNAVNQVSPYSVGRMKTDGAFRDVMANIKKNNKSMHSNVKTGNLSQI